MPSTLAYFLISSVVWVGILVIPPGSKTVAASYRLNFAQGVVCSLFAIMSLAGYLPEDLTVMACTGYFFVDTVNKLLNDFYFKVPSYQKGIVRIVEYVHHTLSLIVATYSVLYYQEVCSTAQNPVLRIALAELSTPFLVAWRETRSDWMGLLFMVVFFFVRIVYQGGVLMPEIVTSCRSPLIVAFSLGYVALNVWFMVMIARKAIKGVQGKKKTEEKTEGMKLD